MYEYGGVITHEIFGLLGFFPDKPVRILKLVFNKNLSAFRF